MNFKNKSNKQQENDIDDGFGEYSETKKWYTEISDDPIKFEPVTDQVLIDLKDEAKKCLANEIANHKIKSLKNNSDFRWMKVATSKGTVSDKVAASTILIQNNPVVSLETLESLVSLVKSGKKRECLIVIDNLIELFLSDLLRPDKKLIPFDRRPFSLLNQLSSGNAVTRRKYLTYWYFEDQLKSVYSTFVTGLNKLAQDTVEKNKEKSIGAMYRLLEGNSEQEKNLLAYIVNKLGDPSQKVASKSMYCLSQLLLKHPNMQEVVLAEVEKLVFRQNVSRKAQYYGLCFLSQFYLSHETSNVARKLIEVYFSFFKLCVAKGEIDSRMMSALLMGVNRAYPYSKMEMEKVSEHIDTMYKVVHMANFNVALHTLTLLYQVSDFADNINDRFYSALYKKLLDPKLPTTTHQAILLNLLFKAINKDKETNRIIAFIKRLLQISISSEPSFACGILYLISKLCAAKQNVLLLESKESDNKDLLNKFDDGDGFERYVDKVDLDETDLNQTSEPENKDSEKEENKDTENQEEKDTEKQGKKDTEKQGKKDTEKQGKKDTEKQGKKDTEKQEKKDTEKQEEGEEDIKPDVEELNKSLGFGWVHRTSVGKVETDCSRYDPTRRNPLYAGAQNSVYAELDYLRRHQHPTVALFASKISEAQPITYSGDPLKDFTTIRFLDRFAFKNPKRAGEDAERGAHPVLGKRKAYRPAGLKSVTVTSDRYLSQVEKNIPVDELFVYKFLQNRRESRPANTDDTDDLDSVASEEFEEMLNKMQSMKDMDAIDEDIDFMNEIGSNLKNKPSKKGVANDRQPEETNDDDDEEDFGSEDDEIDDDDGDMMDDEDDDLSDMVFDSSDENVEEKGDDDKSVLKKLKKKHGKGGKSVKKGLGDVFASAEEFASILEDEGGAAKRPGGSDAVSDKDKAGAKQISWEENRNRWLHGYKKAVGHKGAAKSKQRQKRQYPAKSNQKNNKNNNNKKRKIK